MLKKLKKLYRKILNIIFPIYCVGCKKENISLCVDCINNFPSALNTSVVSDISLFDYKDETVKRSMWLLKYRGNRDIGKIFASSLYDRLLDEVSERNMFSHFHNPIMTPIPLSKKRLKERGFNQSEIIAKELSFIDNDTSFKLVADVLYKTKDTPSQVSIKDRATRLQNLRGCFSVKNPGVIKNRNIILIDDITTTGATIKEARKTLLGAGAKKVIAFTIAH